MQEYLGIAIAGLLLSQLLKQMRSSLYIYPIVAAGIVIVLKLLPMLSQSISDVAELAVHISGEHESTLLLISGGGIGMLGAVGSVLCESFGEKQLARTVEFAATVCILTMAVPLLITVAEDMLGLLNMIGQ